MNLREAGRKEAQEPIIATAFKLLKSGEISVGCALGFLVGALIPQEEVEKLLTGWGYKLP